jgi:hypothetical protein
MESKLNKIEEIITAFWTHFFRNLLFFLNDSNKSFFVSVLHYAIFIFGFYYFFFHSKPGELYRVIFFIFILMGAFSYFIFNRCLITSIEKNLSSEKNSIQSFISRYFGEEIEGNITSKIVLSASSVLIGLILLNDYRLIKI